MTDEVFRVAVWVERWGAAVHRPELEARADELTRRFVSASLHPPVAPPQARVFDSVDLGDLPLDDVRRSRGDHPRAATTAAVPSNRLRR